MKVVEVVCEDFGYFMILINNVGIVNVDFLFIFNDIEFFFKKVFVVNCVGFWVIMK